MSSDRSNFDALRPCRLRVIPLRFHARTDGVRGSHIGEDIGASEFKRSNVLRYPTLARIDRSLAKYALATGALPDLQPALRRETATRSRPHINKRIASLRCTKVLRS